MQAPGQPPHDHRMCMPLDQLRDVPGPIQCPYCGFQGVTRVEHVAGRRTRRSAGLLFAATVVLAPVPYLTNGTKDVRHFCANCRVCVAVWLNERNSPGQTHVVAHQNRVGGT
ncbi:hypothetical protein Z517_04464 [Fonsecaea pedrosoi CBS 271.37]|uniref:LITAF domain-containing protein n=1 Tax=Fonsecaea pedrosoi CBS 271.37 TaxID=1442368 RepID=A0A0D2HA69_9EURO|nr:uncharacterized protein Z517_04464 [Fonsecaea pedrosoi CBS 271.37]KIW81439.1 hypothetical protein Z517_04464 [Fonsecaea pedrosoi CBS 271.37]